MRTFLSVLMLAHASALCLTDTAGFAASDGYGCADWGADFDGNGVVDCLASQDSINAAAGFSQAYMNSIRAGCPATCGVCSAPCADTANFAASDGYGCADWGGDFDGNGVVDCLASQDSINAAAGFSQAYMENIRSNCPVTCLSCSSSSDDGSPAYLTFSVTAAGTVDDIDSDDIGHIKAAVASLFTSVAASDVSIVVRAGSVVITVTIAYPSQSAANSAQPVVSSTIATPGALVAALTAQGLGGFTVNSISTVTALASVAGDAVADQDAIAISLFGASVATCSHIADLTTYPQNYCAQALISFVCPISCGAAYTTADYCHDQDAIYLGQYGVECPVIAASTQGCAGSVTPFICPGSCNVPPAASCPPPPAPPPAMSCSWWCNSFTCDMGSCTGCETSGPMCADIAAGLACSSWCNAFTCGFEHCDGCQVCREVDAGTHCASWCNAYTCGSDMCAGCTACADLTAGTYCASWCNEFTTDMEHCTGC